MCVRILIIGAVTVVAEVDVATIAIDARPHSAISDCNISGTDFVDENFSKFSVSNDVIKNAPD